jgi:hypothetical protein
MKKNVGSLDRLMRVVAGLAMLAGAAFAPLPLAVRLAGLGMMGAYLLFTAVAGTCAGYHLMGKSTCPTASHH